MLKTILAAIVTILATAANAQVTYVSGKGNDSGNCQNPTQPCRTFQFAINQIGPEGEVKTLDPADYGQVTVTNKLISLTGVNGAGIDTNGGNAITIIASGSNTTTAVRITNLIIQSLKSSSGSGIISSTLNGVNISMNHCTVRGFDIGINLNRAGFVIEDTIITNNTTGIIVRGGGILGRSAIIENGTGIVIFVGTSTVIRSFGDNHIRGNGTDIKGGTLTNVGTQ